MTERLLQYIWQFQHFNNSALITVENEKLQIIHPGTINSNQGPDFTNAKIVLPLILGVILAMLLGSRAYLWYTRIKST